MLRSALLSFAALTAVAMVPVSASACGEGKTAAAHTDMSVEQVAVAIKTGSAIVYDVNGAETRTKFGVVPGAKMLSHHAKFASTELPASKATQLVFYCANEMCGASEGAASMASAAGYKKVAVMRAGIMGWTKAGKKSAAAPTS